MYDQTASNFGGAIVCEVPAKGGFLLKRQRGSHIVLQRDDPFALVVVPDHKELDRGTLRSILRQADITPDEFSALLLSG